MDNYDIINNIKDNGTFILNTSIFSLDKIWNFIPILGSTWVQIRWNALLIIPLIIFSLLIFNFPEHHQKK